MLGGPVQLSQKLRSATEKLQRLKAEEADACTTAILMIAGPDADPERYKDATLEELLQMKVERQDSRRAASAEGGARAEFGATAAQVEIQRLEECVLLVVSLEIPPALHTCVLSVFVAIHRLQRTIQGRIEQLTAQLNDVGTEVSEMEDLRQQVHEAAEMFRFEKDARTRALEDVKAANEKVRPCRRRVAYFMGV